VLRDAGDNVQSEPSDLASKNLETSAVVNMNNVRISCREIVHSYEETRGFAEQIIFKNPEFLKLARIS